LTDAEKGDAVLSLWANYDKYETIKNVAEEIKVPYNTVRKWLSQARHLSEKIKNMVSTGNIPTWTAKALTKYPIGTQDKLAEVIIRKEVPSGDKTLKFLKLFDANPQRDLDSIADELLGVKTVTVPESKIPREVLDKINEEKKQFAKIQKLKPRKKPSKPITKEEVLKKQEAKMVWV